jgi:hypothetical protein
VNVAFEKLIEINFSNVTFRHQFIIIFVVIYQQPMDYGTDQQKFTYNT